MPPACRYPIVSPPLQKTLASALQTLRKPASKQAPLGLSSCSAGLLHAHVKLPTGQATPPHPGPVISARRGRGLPRDPAAVEELQGASPAREPTVCGGLPKLLHSPCCPAPLHVLLPCRRTAVTSEENEGATTGPRAACCPARSWSSWSCLMLFTSEKEGRQ